MRRCLKPGCPALCGTRRKPRCADRLLYYVLLVFLMCTVLASTVSGLGSAAKRSRTPAAVTERPPAVTARILDITHEHKPKRTARPSDENRKGLTNPAGMNANPDDSINGRRHPRLPADRRLPEL